jgi:hypothetical protein
MIKLLLFFYCGCAAKIRVYQSVYFLLRLCRNFFCTRGSAAKMKTEQRCVLIQLHFHTYGFAAQNSNHTNLGTIPRIFSEKSSALS